MQQSHLRLFDGPPPLAVVTMRAGSHQVGPHVLSSQVAWDDVIDGQVGDVLAAILAGVVIPSQHFPFGQLNPRARPVDHFFQADDGWARENLPYSLDLTAAIQDQAGFSIDDEGNGTPGIADVDRLEISIEHQHRGYHSELQCREL